MPPRPRKTDQPDSLDQAVEVARTLDYPDLDGVTVHRALVMVQREIGAIAKDRRTDSKGGGPKYNFRGIDDVLNACHQPFARWGVRVIPTGWTQIESDVGSTKSGTVQLHVRGTHDFTIYGPNGDYITASCPAEALDLSDKAASKAMSMAYKYIVIQMLAIPVDAGALDESDQDSTPYETAPPPDQADMWAKYDEAIASLGMDRETASAKWREQQGGMTVDEMMALPVERVFVHIRSVVAYARTRAQQQAAADAGQSSTPHDNETEK